MKRVNALTPNRAQKTAKAAGLLGPRVRKRVASAVRREHSQFLTRPKTAASRVRKMMAPLCPCRAPKTIALSIARVTGLNGANAQRRVEVGSKFGSGTKPRRLCLAVSNVCSRGLILTTRCRFRM